MIRNANQFLVHKLLYPHITQLTPVARLFYATERQFGIRPIKIIDQHHSCALLKCANVLMVLMVLMVLASFGLIL
jgi:hypothetical protein